jgi:hypothetical protein
MHQYRVDGNACKAVRIAEKEYSLGFSFPISVWFTNLEHQTAARIILWPDSFIKTDVSTYIFLSSSTTLAERRVLSLFKRK